MSASDVSSRTPWSRALSRQPNCRARDSRTPASGPGRASRGRAVASRSVATCVDGRPPDGVGQRAGLGPGRRPGDGRRSEREAAAASRSAERRPAVRSWRRGVARSRRRGAEAARRRARRRRRRPRTTRRTTASAGRDDGDRETGRRSCAAPRERWRQRRASGRVAVLGDVLRLRTQGDPQRLTTWTSARARRSRDGRVSRRITRRSRASLPDAASRCKPNRPA